MTLFSEITPLEVLGAIGTLIGTVATTVLLCREKWKDQNAKEKKSQIELEDAVKKSKIELEDFEEEKDTPRMQQIVKEYKKLYDDEKKRGDERRRVHEADMDRVAREMKEQEARLVKLHADHLQCEVRAAKQEERLNIQEKMLQQLSKDIESMKSLLQEKGIGKVPPGTAEHVPFNETTTGEKK